MTRIERERLVEQYLEGSMDFAQEENFFIQVAIDDELRRTLKSYRIVEEAIRKEREVGVREHAGARRFVAGMLLAVPQPTEQTAAADPTRGRMKKAKKYGTRRIVMTIAAAGLVLLGWIGIRQLVDREAPAVQSPASAPLNNHQSTIGNGRSAGGDRQVALDGQDSPSDTRDQQIVSRSASAGTEATRGTPATAEATPNQTTEPISSEPNRSPLKLRIDSTLKNPPRQEPVQLPVEIDWGSQKK